jgi:signal transduction histidine kinase
LESLEIATARGLKEQMRDANEKLYLLEKKEGNHEASLKYLELYNLYRDSITNHESIQRLADLRTQFEVGIKQGEVDLLTEQHRNQQLIMAGLGVILLLIVIIAIVIYKNYREKNLLNKKLSALNATKDKFFSIISHDLRGPVAAFNGVARMIKFAVTMKQTEELLEIAEQMDKSTNQLSSLLDNLLSWASQQQGQFSHIPEKLNLNKLVDDLFKVFGNMASGKQIDLSMDIKTSVDLWGDKNTTNTILRNLINNALKFTPEGGRIAVSADYVDEDIEIKVKDSGVGMSPEKVKDLFKFKAAKSEFGTEGEKGLGLGLQLVNDFIQLNNGTIRVISEVGKGTTFILILPAFSEQETPSAKRKAKSI